MKKSRGRPQRTFSEGKEILQVAVLIEKTIELAWAAGLTEGEIADYCGAHLAFVTTKSNRGILSQKIEALQSDLSSLTGNQKEE